MNVVWKYVLLAPAQQTISMPCVSRILSVAQQNGQVVMYVMVDDKEQMMCARHIEVVGTGDQFSYNVLWKFIGTVMTCNDARVWHVFENHSVRR